MYKDELFARQDDDTITLLLRAARRAGFDVDPPKDAGEGARERRHLKAVLVAICGRARSQDR